MIKFTTKDLTVSEVDLGLEFYDEGENIKFFVDHKNGKGITTAPTLKQAIEFAEYYQTLL